MVFVAARAETFSILSANDSSVLIIVSISSPLSSSSISVEMVFPTGIMGLIRLSDETVSCAYVVRLEPYTEINVIVNSNVVIFNNFVFFIIILL